jgi:hypothetical protein
MPATALGSCIIVRFASSVLARSQLSDWCTSDKQSRSLSLKFTSWKLREKSVSSDNSNNQKMRRHHDITEQGTLRYLTQEVFLTQLEEKVQGDQEEEEWEV